MNDIRECTDSIYKIEGRISTKLGKRYLNKGNFGKLLNIM